MEFVAILDGEGAKLFPGPHPDEAEVRVKLIHPITIPDEYWVTSVIQADQIGILLAFDYMGHEKETPWDTLKYLTVPWTNIIQISLHTSDG